MFLLYNVILLLLLYFSICITLNILHTLFSGLRQGLRVMVIFPYFGGKVKVASVVWKAFGEVERYAEPFFGTGAVLFNRPSPFTGVELVNDSSGFVVNFWRAVQNDPYSLAYYTSDPFYENNYHAIHIKLMSLEKDLDRKLEGSPTFYDPEIAGYWLWGACNSIGSAWCNHRQGPWKVVDGKLVKEGEADCTFPPSIARCKLRLTSPNSGVFSNMDSSHTSRYEHVLKIIVSLSNRLDGVKILSGDWSRAVTDANFSNISSVGVFLDPPYLSSNPRDIGYSCSKDVTLSVLEWCKQRGDLPRFKIALCGYEGDYSFPPSWKEYKWSQHGFLTDRSLSNRERIWFSPYCNSVLDDDYNEYIASILG